MGEYAEYMINGDDCMGCGEYIGPGGGYGRYCNGCNNQRKEENDFLYLYGSHELGEFKDWLEDREFDFISKGRRDRRGQPMICLKNDGDGAGLVVCKTLEVYDLAHKIAQQYKKESKS